MNRAAGRNCAATRACFFRVFMGARGQRGDLVQHVLRPGNNALAARIEQPSGEVRRLGDVVLVPTGDVSAQLAKRLRFGLRRSHRH